MHQEKAVTVSSLSEPQKAAFRETLAMMMREGAPVSKTTVFIMESTPAKPRPTFDEFLGQPLDEPNSQR